MRRREFITLLGGVAASIALDAHAQDRPAMLRIGSTTLRGISGSLFEIILNRLHQMGYVAGNNLAVDFIDLKNNLDGYGESMRELVRRKADIIVAFGPEISLKSAIAATSTIPIVMIAIDYDPFARGYVKKSCEADRQRYGSLSSANHAGFQAHSIVARCAAQHPWRHGVLGRHLDRSMARNPKGGGRVRPSNHRHQVRLPAIRLRPSHHAGAAGPQGVAHSDDLASIRPRPRIARANCASPQDGRDVRVS